MDLDSRLANLSLGEIASLLSPKQQEVLLASISVAATLIQQIQQEDSMHQQQTEMLGEDESDEEELPSMTDGKELNSFTDTESDHHIPTLTDNERHHHNHNHQTSMADEKDLPTIRQFADELKQRRKSIRLSQKGAAQSLRAFTGGVQPCTDAIIYHFENLQLEPERAMQLIPLLRDWLEWAEKHRYNGKQLPMMSAVTKVPRERKRKVVLFNEKAKQYLEDAFLKNNHPDRYQLDVISQELNIPTRSIRKWFTNRRQRKRFAEKFSFIN